jgi:2-dehydro-3-deoxyphosphogluconate aldolase/(4S)-4-hydroxy-2-oxoglutarate aldolase
MQLGANFVVTPVLREDIALVCNRRKVLWSPGCGSLTEITRAEELGCEIVKLFPGGTYGPSFVKAIKGPQPWTSIMLTGGVSPTEENLKGWFNAGVTCVGMGSQLISKEIIETKNFEALKNNVQKALLLIKNLKIAK